jgi:Mg2+/Co2+ transporter CorB
MDNTVALASIALAASSVAALVWVVKYFAKSLTSALKEHTKAAQGQIKSSDEVLKFMINLNGKLENAYIEKAKEK